MTTNSMTCDAFADRLMAYLEDDTDAATRAALERHAATCAECGALLADLRKLRSDAAHLPELAPSRDLWSGIAARIEAPVVSIGTATTGARTAPTRRFWRVGLLAASLVGTTAVGYLAGTRTNAVAPKIVSGPGVTDTVMLPATDAPALEGRVATGDATARPPVAAPATVAPASVAPASVASAPYNAQLVVAGLTADYDREIRQLTQLLDARRNQLDPVTVAIIERNLQVIDVAITESKQAIARDPASRFLIESLNQSLQMKVELMRTAAMLPSRI